MKTIKKVLTAEAIANEISTCKTNIEFLRNVPGAEKMISEYEARLAELTADEAKLAGVDKVAEFANLFTGAEVVIINGEEVSALTEAQIAFIGEGVTVKLTADGKLTLVKKAGGNGGSGTKSPTPYKQFELNGKTFTTAADLVKAEGGILDTLKAGGVTIKVSTGNSMRREAVKLNAEHKLNVNVTDRETNEVYALLDSPHEKKGAGNDAEDEVNDDDSQA